MVSSSSAAKYEIDSCVKGKERDADRNLFDLGPDPVSESPSDEDARAKLAPAIVSINRKPSSGSRIDLRVLSGVIGAR